MHLKINDSFFISDIQRSDKAAYIEHLQEKEIYDQTLNIPFPYTEQDADEWLGFVARQAEHCTNWAIRRKDGFLVGGIGFHGQASIAPHRGELGYWLAKPFWNQGIMTEAVKLITRHGFAELGLKRITAHVFVSNKGSARVLEKAGYHLEGRLKQHYYKDGKIFDGFLYARVSAEDMQ